MSYIPCQAILAALEDQYGCRLASHETISDQDLQALWEVIQDQEHEIARLEDALDEAIIGGRRDRRR